MERANGMGHWRGLLGYWAELLGWATGLGYWAGLLGWVLGWVLGWASENGDWQGRVRGGLPEPRVARDAPLSVRSEQVYSLLSTRLTRTESVRGLGECQECSLPRV